MNRKVRFKLTSNFKKELKRLEHSGNKKAIMKLQSVIKKIISQSSSDSTYIDLSEFKPDPFENAGTPPVQEASNKILHLHLAPNDVLIYLISADEFIIDVNYTTLAKHDDYEREGKWEKIKRLVFEENNKRIADFAYSKQQIEYVESCFKELVKNETLNLDTYRRNMSNRSIISKAVKNIPDDIKPFSEEDFHFILRMFLDNSGLSDVLEAQTIHMQPIYCGQEILQSEVDAILDLMSTYKTIDVFDYSVETTEDDTYGEFITLFIDCEISNVDDQMLFNCELSRLLRQFRMGFDLVDAGNNTYTYEIFHYID